MKIIACFLIGKQEKEELLCSVFVSHRKSLRGIQRLFSFLPNNCIFGTFWDLKSPAKGEENHLKFKIMSIESFLTGKGIGAGKQGYGMGGGA